MECERVLITRFRTGSHSLAIELGRISGVTRLNRLCTCRLGVQTVWHVFSDCPITRHIHGGQFTNLQDVFNAPNLVQLILQISAVLKIPI